MPKSTKQDKRKAFAYHVLNQLELVKAVNMRAMFGGYGLYARGFFFGLIWQDAVYLFTNVETRKRFKRAKSWPFVFREGETDGNYWAVPDAVLTNPKKLAEWAEEAIAARTEFEQSKPPRVKRKKAEREIDEDRFY